MTGGALVVVVLAIGLGGGLLLFLAVRAEANRREQMTREDAEQAARRDTGRGPRDPQENRTDR